MIIKYSFYFIKSSILNIINLKTFMKKINLIELMKRKSNFYRMKILGSINLAQKGHLGGSFSCLDILISLYYSKIFNLRKKYINKPERDFSILSKGHVTISLI